MAGSLLGLEKITAKENEAILYTNWRKEGTKGIIQQIQKHAPEMNEQIAAQQELTEEYEEGDILIKLLL